MELTPRNPPASTSMGSQLQSPTHQEGGMSLMSILLKSWDRRIQIIHCFDPWFFSSKLRAVFTLPSLQRKAVHVKALLGGFEKHFHTLFSELRVNPV